MQRPSDTHTQGEIQLLVVQLGSYDVDTGEMSNAQV